MSIELHNGDILTSCAEAICVPVNCRGIMGAGLAKAAAERFNSRTHGYMLACRRKELRPGALFVDNRPTKQPRALVFVATKDDWRKPSELHWIGLAAKRLKQITHDLKLASIAIPALGCGLGELAWADVEPLLRRAFSEDNGVRVLLFAPHESSVHRRKV